MIALMKHSVLSLESFQKSMIDKAYIEQRFLCSY